MITSAVQGSATTSAVVLSDRISGVKGNSLMVAVRVGGSGHAEADFLAHVLNVTLRHKLGENIPLVSGLRMLDLLKISDYDGGFSADLEADDGTVYCGKISIGSVVLQEEDSLEISLSLPGDATATYAYRISLVEAVSQPEMLVGYELITGNGSAQLIKDCYTLFLVSNPAGNTISIMSPDGTENVLDYDVVDLANCSGRMESYEEIGVLYSDKLGLSQEVTVKLPANAYAVAVRGFFQLARATQRSRSVEIDNTALLQKISQKNPEKFEVLRLLGKV